VSTVAAFVAAGAGVPVAKHGNRSVTSPSGSADVLEALGAKLEVPPEKVQAVIEKVGIGFLFAPQFHPAMRLAAPVRKELGVRTVFNLLGPLTNPAGAKAQVLGVFHADLVDTYADVLLRLGAERAMVVHGTAGLDEVSTLGPTLVAEVDGGQVRKYALHPREFGLREVRADQVAGRPPAESAKQVLGLLSSGLDDAPRREMVLLNAACAIYVAGNADSVREGVQRARESVESGAALGKLLEFVKATGGSVPAAVGGPISVK
ncbi:MAG: anthranilate phosphoribosyltransferase, partial [bacterium]